MPAPSDTSNEAERVLIDAYRRMPFPVKWRQMGSIYRTAKLLHAAGVRQRIPGATEEQIRDDWMAATLGEDLFREVKEALCARHEAFS
jgi:hypothetical protein